MFIRQFDNQFFIPVIKHGSSKSFLNLWIYLNGIPSVSSEYLGQIELKNGSTKIAFEAKTVPVNKHQDKVIRSQMCLVLSKQMLKTFEIANINLNVFRNAN